MFSEPYPTNDEVMTELGDKFLIALVDSVRAAREIGAPLLSLRDGRDNVIWAVELDEPAQGVQVTWSPIEPTLPTIDFGDLDDERNEPGASDEQ